VPRSFCSSAFSIEGMGIADSKPMATLHRSASFRRSRSVAVLLAAASLLAVASCDRESRLGQPQAATSGVGLASPQPDFRDAIVGADMRALVRWVVATDDHGRRPFAVVDKREARIHVFDDRGRLVESASILLGQAIGDDSVPGIGSKAIADIPPEERTTPAGRFVTMPGRNANDRPVVWVDYDGGVSMHVVITGNPSEQRLERLASSDPARHRISWGCINLPADFFQRVVQPTFAEPGGIVYVLPETRPLGDVFAMTSISVAR
jgi:hypothetical protein